MSAGIIIILLLALLLVIFTLQNTALISLNLLFWDIHDVPLVLALIICLILGFMVALAFYTPKIWKLKSKVKEQQKSLSKIRQDQEQQSAPNEDDIETTGKSEKGFFNN